MLTLKEISWSSRHSCHTGFIGSARVAEIFWEAGMYKVIGYGPNVQLVGRVKDLTEAKALARTLVLRLLQHLIELRP